MGTEVLGGRTRQRVVKGLCAALALVAIAAHAQAASAPARRPVVVELFTAQGCASCRDSDALIERLKDKPGVIALSYSVDYWDYLGWADTFAKPEFTARQRAYVARLGLKDIYTPAVVIDGRREAPGVEAQAIEALVAGPRPRLIPAPPTLRLTRKGSRVEIGAAGSPAGGAELWLIRYDPARREVKVKAGDNKDRTVIQSNGVRELVRLGTWSGRTRSFPLPPAKAPGLKTVLLLQAVRGDRGVLAAATG